MMMQFMTCSAFYKYLIVQIIAQSDWLEKFDRFSMGAKISGATVWTGIDGFGKRRRSTVHLEGITINMPMMMEIIDEKSKLEPLLPQIRRMVGDNGLVTLHEVNVI